MQNTIKRKINRNKLQEDDLSEVISSDQLGFFVESKVQNKFTVHIDTEFVQPSFYRNVIEMMDSATEDDLIVFKINSPGGQLASLQSLVEALKSTDAHTVAVLVGECASAASIFSMYCNSVVVTDSANMLAHHVSYSTGGKGADIVSHVQHMAKISEKFMHDAYKNFLTEAEIVDIIAGKEMYIDADEIRERFAKRQELFEAEENHLESEKDKDANPVPTPKRKRKKSSTV
jgi:ATP-dependent protease ClpP protease subunit